MNRSKEKYYFREENFIMIYLTGDTHGNFSKLRQFAASDDGSRLTKKDYVIVLGDFGVWSDTVKDISQLDSELPFTLMFLDGNHEDFGLLSSMPEKRMFGGIVRDLGGVYHLKRGEVYDILDGDGIKTLAVCGGGTSRDREMRTKGVDWFPEEEITEDDVSHMLDNVARRGGKADAFLSHSPSSEVKFELFAEASFSRHKPAVGFIPSENEYRIRNMIGKIETPLCFSGHEHIDRKLTFSGKEYIIVYNAFIKL